MLAFYERGSALGAAPPHDDAPRHAGARWPSTWPSSWSVPKGLFPQQDTGPAHGVAPRRRRTSRSPEMIAPAAAGQQGRSTRTRTSTTTCRSSAPAASARATPARRFIMLKPQAARARLTADQVIARLRGKLAKIAGISTYLISRQDVNVGGRLARTQYQYTVQDANLVELLDVGAALLDALRKLPAAQGRQHRPAERGAPARRRHRPRHGLAPGRHRAGHRRRALRRVRAARSSRRPSRSSTSTTSSWRRRRRTATRPTRSTASTCRAPRGAAGAAARHRQGDAGDARRSRSTTTGSSRR